MTERRCREVLGVGPKAGPEEIKQAYRRLARRWHPDANSGSAGAAKRFLEVARAYQVLKNLRCREEGSVVRLRQESPTPGQSDVMSVYWQAVREGVAQGWIRGPEIEGQIEVAPREALHGGRKLLAVTETKVCESCSGHGKVAQPCTRCKGAGLVNRGRRISRPAAVCRDCGGTGRSSFSACERCDGIGQQQTRQLLAIRLPGGLRTGMRLRIPRAGAPGQGSLPRDVVLQVRVREVLCR